MIVLPAGSIHDLAMQAVPNHVIHIAVLPGSHVCYCPCARGEPGQRQFTSHVLATTLPE